MLAIKETKEKNKYNVTDDKIVFEAKDGETVLGFAVCEIKNNLFVIEKIDCDDELIFDSIKRTALNYAVNRNIIEADFLGEPLDIVEFFSRKCH